MNTNRYHQLLNKNIDSLIAGIIGFIVIYLFTKHSGIGISPDSIAYLSVARNMGKGLGIIDFSGRPMVDFPAFYAGVLFVISFITREDILVFAPILNGLLFASVIYTSGCIMEKFMQPAKWYKWILLACITLSPTMIEVFSMLWSETLFILLSLLFFVALYQYLRKHSNYSLAGISLIAAVAFVTRYAGITFIAIGGLLILFDKNINAIKKIIHLLIFGSVGISLGLINIIRNQIVSGSLAGIRQKSITPLYKNMEHYGSVLNDWLGFSMNNHDLFFILGITIWLILGITFIIHIINFSNYSTYENIGIIFFLIYTLFILLSSTLSRYETINSRLLAPAFIPFIWSLSYYLPQWIKQTKTSQAKWLKITASTIFALLILCNESMVIADNYSYMKDSGIPGYTEDDWALSDIVQYIKKNNDLFKLGEQIYSNQNHAIYFYTNYQTQTVPETVHQQEVSAFYQCKKSYLVWFNNELNKDLLSLSEINKHKKLTPIHRFKDGTIYLCTNDSSTIK